MTAFSLIRGALDPLIESDRIVARDEQERKLATIRNGVYEGYLPTTVSIHGPPGTDKTLTTRWIAREFTARTDDLAVEDVNLKECWPLFSATSGIHFELTGEKRGAYEGLDGVFEESWGPRRVSRVDEIYPRTLVTRSVRLYRDTSSRKRTFRLRASP